MLLFQCSRSPGPNLTQTPVRGFTCLHVSNPLSALLKSKRIKPVIKSIVGMVYKTKSTSILFQSVIKKVLSSLLPVLYVAYLK